MYFASACMKIILFTYIYTYRFGAPLKATQSGCLVGSPPLDHFVLLSPRLP